MKNIRNIQPERVQKIIKRITRSHLLNDVANAHGLAFLDTLAILPISEELKGKARACYLVKLSENLAKSIESQEDREIFLLKSRKGLVKKNEN